MYGIERGGGWNKTHEQLERYSVLDSFRIGHDELDSFTLSWRNGNKVSALRIEDRLVLGYKTGGEQIREDIDLSFVSNGFGGKPRIYFHCPACGCRVQKLYYKDRLFKCRKCHKINYRSQQVAKGCDQWADKMNKILRDDFGYTKSLTPYDAMCERPWRPKWMRTDTYNKNRIKLLRAQVAYSEAFQQSMASLLGRWR